MSASFKEIVNIFKPGTVEDFPLNARPLGTSVNDI
jgi:hypothetical protein